MSGPTKLILDPRAVSDARWRARWRAVRELLGGALILAVWLSLWSWVALGVAAPLGRMDHASPQHGRDGARVTENTSLVPRGAGV